MRAIELLRDHVKVWLTVLDLYARIDVIGITPDIGRVLPVNIFSLVSLLNLLSAKLIGKTSVTAAH